MPVDLKWIRNSPDLVRGWQEQRGLSSDIVDRVIDHDNRCRTLLKDLDNQRAKLKRLQKSMRPSKITSLSSVNKEEILQERKLVEESIRQVEEEWKTASKETRHALWCVASPIDDQVLSSYLNLSARISSGIQHKKFPQFDFSSGPGLDFGEAIHALARRRFEHFKICKFPAMVSMKTEECNEWSLDSDLAHSMCGGKTSYEFEICDKSAKIDGWLGMIVHRFPPKSIFGAKQLPQFISIWGRPDACTVATTDTFEVIAMSSGTIWDSRAVQLGLVRELEDFYKSLLQSVVADTEQASKLTAKAVPANELEMHELCRVVLETPSKRPLGWVSNFGDSAARSNDIHFSSGGQKAKKEYVHFVRAVVLTTSIISTLLNENTSGESVNIPRSLVALLPTSTTEVCDADETRDWFSIPLKCLMKQDRLQFFGPAKKRKPHKPDDGIKFSLDLQAGDIKHSLSPDRMKMAALACPFDFLFPQ